MLDAALSLMMLACIALLLGAAYLFRRGERKRPALMVVAALVLAVNIGIWTLPTTGGDAPLSKVEGR
ncbi:hypothetical protein RXV95_04970 [Novosphingobium sp. ZN18A2]|uniref:hypothetical protein n=1 Tax=Novosphingobium sp. ZN18A2 TaxID=3079861 RepID=UPI0030CB0BF1